MMVAYLSILELMNLADIKYTVEVMQLAINITIFYEKDKPQIFQAFTANLTKWEVGVPWQGTK